MIEPELSKKDEGFFGDESVAIIESLMQNGKGVLAGEIGKGLLEDNEECPYCQA